MAIPSCDFFDWGTHRRCAEPATWVTHQTFGQALHGARYYCDAHRPPRARPFGANPPALEPPAPKRRHKA
ncbi:MAG TPA: hypothetical protein VGV12_15170 [Gemmatimonadales bacterium]|nr:hypothetical protein [Gemmatimonadales bacterium]